MAEISVGPSTIPRPSPNTTTALTPRNAANQGVARSMAHPRIPPMRIEVATTASARDRSPKNSSAGEDAAPRRRKTARRS